MTYKDLSATVVEAVYEKRREEKDATEKIESLSQKNEDQVNERDRTSLTQSGCKVTMTRVFKHARHDLPVNHRGYLVDGRMRPDTRETGKD